MAIIGECVGTGAPLPYPGAQAEVISSAGGYFIGFLDTDGQVYSRESRYYPTLERAEEAFDAGVYSRILLRHGNPLHTTPLLSRPDVENTPIVQHAAKTRIPRGRRDIGFGANRPAFGPEQVETMLIQWQLVSHQAGLWTASELRLIDEWHCSGIAWRDIATTIERCLLSAARPSQLGQAVSQAHRTWTKRHRPSRFDTARVGAVTRWEGTL